MPARTRYGQLLRRQRATYYWPLLGPGTKLEERLRGVLPISQTSLGFPAQPLPPQDGAAGVTFDGSASNAVTDDVFQFQRQISLSMWLRPEAAGSGTDPLIMEYTANANSKGAFYIDWSNATWGFIVTVTGAAGTADIVSCTAPTLNAWNHFGVTLDRDASLCIAMVAINGVSQSLTTRINNLAAGQDFDVDNLYIGARGGSSLFWQGSIAHLAIADGALWTEQDYLAQYDCERGRPGRSDTL